MENKRLRECLASDFARLREVVVSAPSSAAVPTCPDWTMADLASHVADVYLHKTECIKQGVEPEPWPPADLAEEAAKDVVEEYSETNQTRHRKPNDAFAAFTRALERSLTDLDDRVDQVGRPVITRYRSILERCYEMIRQLLSRCGDATQRDITDSWEDSAADREDIDS